jgi:hypothetical protein
METMKTEYTDKEESLRKLTRLYDHRVHLKSSRSAGRKGFLPVEPQGGLSFPFVHKLFLSCPFIPSCKARNDR